MPDITMCSGERQSGEVCPWRYRCHRHTAEENPHRQSWFITLPGYLEQGDGWVCIQFMEMAKHYETHPHG